MIRYTYRRPPGGARYGGTHRAAARRLAATDSPDTVSSEALAAMLDPDGIQVVADVLFELESNRLGRPVTTRILVDDVETAPASGDLDTLTDGHRVGDPVETTVTVADLATTDLVVELTWTDRRRASLVEVHGPAGRQIVDASVEIATAPGVWEAAGSATSPAGRLAISLGEVAYLYGVRVHVDGVDGDPTDPVQVVEVDPAYVLDVSENLVEVDVEWARETDPGTATDPVGNYEASELTLVLDDTDGRWNPATNTTLDVGHRIEVAFGVRFVDSGVEVEELFPAGVFYSEPFDTDSRSTNVTISATDRLGRNADTTVAEEVTEGGTIRAELENLAAKYLDLDADQVVVEGTVGDLVFPYLYPSGNLGTYLADIAKATGSTLHVDAYDRLVMARRASVSTEPVATLTDDNALIGFRRPPGYDVTTSIVTVTAAPLEPAPVADLWAMPSGGLTIPAGETYDLVARYDATPALDGTVEGIVADGAYTILSSAFYAERAEIQLRNDEAVPLVVADLRIRGAALVEGSLTARAIHEPSVRRYGPRELEVEAKLIQTQGQVELVAAVLLDAFRSIDDAGVRRLPDLTFDALGLLQLEAGDRVTLGYPAKGLGGDYTVLARRLSYSGGALLSNDVRVRESPSEIVYMVADSGLLADDGVLAGY